MSLKTSLRATIRAKLKSLSPEEISTQSRQLTDIITSLPIYTAASSIAIFLSSPSEIGTDGILDHAFQSGTITSFPSPIVGKRCFIPYCASKTRIEMVATSPTEIASLPLNAFGIREHLNPSPSQFLTKNDKLDIAFVPGCAFDLMGGRLGYGRGYYDRFLSRFYNGSNKPGSERPWLIGLCLSDQIVDKVPMDTHDWRVDMLITWNDVHALT